jgi:hypothetical protein
MLPLVVVLAFDIILLPSLVRETASSSVTTSIAAQPSDV